MDSPSPSSSFHEAALPLNLSSDLSPVSPARARSLHSVDLSPVDVRPARVSSLSSSPSSSHRRPSSSSSHLRSRSIPSPPSHSRSPTPSPSHRVSSLSFVSSSPPPSPRHSFAPALAHPFPPLNLHPPHVHPHNHPISHSHSHPHPHPRPHSRPHAHSHSHPRSSSPSSSSSSSSLSSHPHSHPHPPPHPPQPPTIHLRPHGPCTFLLWGETPVLQDYFECLTCQLICGRMCCAACVPTCHAGHRLRHRGRFPAFCDCGRGQPHRHILLYHAQVQRMRDDEGGQLAHMMRAVSAPSQPLPPLPELSHASSGIVEEGSALVPAGAARPASATSRSRGSAGSWRSSERESVGSRLSRGSSQGDAVEVSMSSRWGQPPFPSTPSPTPLSLPDPDQPGLPPHHVPTDQPGLPDLSHALPSPPHAAVLQSHASSSPTSSFPPFLYGSSSPLPPLPPYPPAPPPPSASHAFPFLHQPSISPAPLPPASSPSPPPVPFRRAQSVPTPHIVGDVFPPPLPPVPTLSTLSTLRPPLPPTPTRTSSRLSSLSSTLRSFFSRRTSPSSSSSSPTPPSLLSMAVAHGFQCTDVLAGGDPLHQPLFQCLTCRASGLCESCVARCHPLHRVRALPPSSTLHPSRCGCGAHCPAKLPPVGDAVQLLSSLCTVRRSGPTPFPQLLYLCHSCGLKEATSALLCQGCAALCHDGHDVRVWGMVSDRWCQCEDSGCVARRLDVISMGEGRKGRGGRLTSRQRRLVGLEGKDEKADEKADEKGDGEEEEDDDTAMHDTWTSTEGVTMEGEGERGMEGRRAREGEYVPRIRLPIAHVHRGKQEEGGWDTGEGRGEGVTRGEGEGDTGYGQVEGRGEGEMPMRTAVNTDESQVEGKQGPVLLLGAEMGEDDDDDDAEERLLEEEARRRGEDDEEEEDELGGPIEMKRHHSSAAQHRIPLPAR